MALVGVLAQFQQYVTDYFTDYRARASEAFLFNRRGGFEYLIERSRTDGIPTIYLKNIGRDVKMIERYWRFYLIKHKREDLLSRTVLLGESDPLDVTTVPAKSAILASANEPMTNALAADGELTLETLIPEPGGRAFYAVFRR